MARFIVYVREQDRMDPVNSPCEWMGMVEAADEFAAAYQYPGYCQLYKWEWFASYHAHSTSELQKNWGDAVCVMPLDALTTSFLST